MNEPKDRSEREKTLEACLAEECEADTDARKAARQVLSEIEVDGDSYGVPSVADIVENLVKREKRLADELKSILGLIRALPVDAMGCSTDPQTGEAEYPYRDEAIHNITTTLTELGYTEDEA